MARLTHLRTLPDATLPACPSTTSEVADGTETRGCTLGSVHESRSSPLQLGSRERFRRSDPVFQLAEDAGFEPARA